MSIVVRKAERSEAEEVLKLIEDLARFEKLDPPSPEARKRFLEDGWSADGKAPKFCAWLAEAKDDVTGRSSFAAYAITFFTYSSFLAKPTLYLEDIFVHEDFRRLGVATSVMNRLIEEAKSEGCGRLEWVVLDWNTNAQTFYQKLGAEHQKEWLPYRITF